MEKLEVTQSNAMKAYNSANTNGKKLLADLFGAEVFNQKITDRVKLFEDACELLGIDPTKVCTGKPDDVLVYDSKSITAYRKLIIIARALNEGWTPDWNDTNQYKWYPYFKFKAGFGFSRTYCAYWLSHTTVGSRLCFKSEELAQYAGKQFEAIYQEFLTL